MSIRLKKDRVRKPVAPEPRKGEKQNPTGPGEVAADRGIAAVAELERAADRKSVV